MTTTAPLFDHAQVAILMREMRIYIISLPIVKDIVTNPGSECCDWQPLVDVRTEKYAAFKRRVQELHAAYNAMGLHGRTKEDRVLMLDLLEQFQILLEGVLGLLDEHSKKVPLNEQYAGELREMRQMRRGRMLEVIRESI